MKQEYFRKGEELLKRLGANTKTVYTNKDVLEARNFSAVINTASKKLKLK